MAIQKNITCSSILLLISQVALSAYSFTIPSSTTYNQHTTALYARSSRPPSKVEDVDDASPQLESDPLTVIDVDDIPNLRYDKDAHPIPDQPWRRGDTDGCEDPIYADWRVEAERIIYNACDAVGARIAGVTWGMSQLMISVLDYSEVEGIIDGPEIIIDTGDDYNEELGPDLTWNPTMSDEEFEDYIDTHPRSVVETLDDPMSDIKSDIDTTALSAIANIITEALSEPSVELRLRVLSRHELILTTPSGLDGVLETQKDFDDHRGMEVLVETRDPFRSNRTLNGKLVNRNALDVVINVKGRMVTIPQNFIYQVKLDLDSMNLTA